jgi:L-alanine-DL-glutamate epimerase-like enolase superfamily enzyme
MHVHLAAASSSCIAIEHFALEKDIYNFEKVIEPSHRLSVENGMAQMSDKPGLGIELDQEALINYALDGEHLWVA